MKRAGATCCHPTAAAAQASLGGAGRCWEALGNEPNHGRVISRNHSMKSKLGTVRVWTRAEEGLVEITTPDLGGGPQITYVPVPACFRIEVFCVFCVFWRGCSGLGALAPIAPALAPCPGLGVLWRSGCLAAHIPSPTPHHMQT